MNTRTQLFCAWCGIAFVALFTLGWWIIAGFVPPMSPALTGDEVATTFQQNTGAIRFGLMLTMISGGLTAPWVAVIAAQMKRIEGEFPVLTYAQLVAGAVGIVIIILPPLIWTAVAFRPDRDPDLMLLLNDLAWLIFIMTFSPAFFQNLVIGLAIFSDRGEFPVFPRWLGYFNIWVAILFIPGGLITFFKTGPFAWDGLLAFWVPLLIFFLWFFVMFAALLKTINQQKVAVSTR
jgi:hypothetical protein